MGATPTKEAFQETTSTTGAPPIKCPAGTYGRTTGQTTSACSGKCAAGYYCGEGSTSPTQNPCPAGYVCAQGTGDPYSTNPPKPCQAGKIPTQDPPAGSACVPCPAGKTSMALDTVCTTCRDGYYCAGGTAPVQCLSGTWSLGGAACTPCAAGYYCPRGTAPIQCGGGTYSAAGATSCITCSPGTFALAGSSSCTPCSVGMYSGAAAAQCNSCAAGYECPTPSTQTPCTPGTFSSSGSTTCTTCRAGTYSAAGAAQCTTCPAGTQSGSGVRCTPCPAGYYSAAGAASCTIAAAGYYTSDSITQIICPAGKASSAGAASCTSCEAGKYSSTTGATSCTPCEAGKYSSTTGATSCITCAKNTYSTAGSRACTACPTGTYATAGDASCVSCGMGELSPACVGVTYRSYFKNWYTITAPSVVRRDTPITISVSPHANFFLSLRQFGNPTWDFTSPWTRGSYTFNAQHSVIGQQVIAVSVPGDGLIGEVTVNTIPQENECVTGIVWPRITLSKPHCTAFTNTIQGDTSISGPYAINRGATFTVTVDAAKYAQYGTPTNVRWLVDGTQQFNSCTSPTTCTFTFDSNYTTATGLVKIKMSSRVYDSSELPVSLIS